MRNWAEMRKTLIFFNLILFITGFGCSTHDMDVTGSWERSVSERDLGITGIEYLNIFEDSTFSVVNKMTFTYSDSIFDCIMGFTTSVNGRMAMRPDNIVMYYHSNTFTIDTICNSVSILSKRGEISDSITLEISKELLYRIGDYYQSVYAELEYPNGLSLRSPKIHSQTLSTFIDETNVVKWNRIEAVD